MWQKVYWPAWAWLALVTAMSVMPGVPMPKFNLFSADKLGHAVAYGVLTWLMLRGYTQLHGAASWKTACYLGALAAAYGVLMEFVQGTFFPNRFFEIDDMLANTAGVVVAVLLLRLRSKTDK
jgi:VanZ family protein